MTDSPEKKELRLFGMGLAFALTVISVICKINRQQADWPLHIIILAAGLLVVALFLPTSLGLLYRLLHPVFELVGLVINTVLLATFYFLIVTPISLLWRVMDRDSLAREFPGKEKTYWRDKTQVEDTTEAYIPHPNLIMEFWDYLRENKNWWLFPIVLLLLLLGIVFIIAGSSAAPFIYPMF